MYLIGQCNRDDHILPFGHHQVSPAAYVNCAFKCVDRIFRMCFLLVNQFPKECDRLNTLQVLWYLTTKEGLAALYRGLFPVLESLCVSNFVYFYTFHCLKSSIRLKESSATLDLIFGMLAGVVNVLGTTPCWVVNTRLKLVAAHGGQNSVEYSNLLEGLIYVGRTEGVAGLWAGTVPSLMLVINPAIQFMVYEGLKRRVLERYSSISGWGVFGIGAVAKAVATIFTYPLQLVQTKLRHGSYHNEDGQYLPKNVNVLQLMLFELKRNGVKGLFRGIEAKLLQTVLTAALMFLTYEKIAKFVFAVLRANRK